jgi:endoglucanase
LKLFDIQSALKEAIMLLHPAFLKTHQDQIMNQVGEVVVLHGAGLGGWMNMENFVSGFPANESAFRNSVFKTLGSEKANYFFDRYLEYFFTEEDLLFIKSLGLNSIRLPFNYRHFENDMNPFVLREAGFPTLDRVIEACARNGIYTILDLHAAPGYQNQDWHSDNPTAQALFWQHKHFQDRAIWLWEIIADRYKDNPWVAGYNPLNEPADPSGKVIQPFYRRVVEAIRRVDPNHIIFLEGNRFSQDFSFLEQPFENTVYAPHHYPTPGFIDGGAYPGVSRGEYIDKSVVQRELHKICKFMLGQQAPIWIGEFGPVYTGIPEKDEMRYQLLRDQLALYAELKASWCLWTYKDLGLQGMVSLLPETKWVQKIQPLLELKSVLGVDSWGGTDRSIRPIMEPIEQAFTTYFPNYVPFPFDARWTIHRTVRHILLAEPLLEEFDRLLGGLSFEEIDGLMASFQLKNCKAREELCRIIQKQI